LPALFPDNMLATLAGQAYAKATLLIGLAYAIVAVLLFFASQLYAGWLLQLPAPRDLAILLLVGAIIPYKSYSSVAHVVFEEIAHLSPWTASVVGAAAALGAAASFAVEATEHDQCLCAGSRALVNPRSVLRRRALNPAIVSAWISLMCDGRYRCDIAFHDAARGYHYRWTFACLPSCAYPAAG
jgi:hypothetical protein